MKGIALLPLFVALALVAGCGEQNGVTKRPDKAVLDSADIFPAAEETALDGRLRAYYDKSGNALVVVSVKSLEGQSIDDYAFKLFNTWGIGDAKTNRGLLVLVAPSERKVRIEVGCGLESAITNATASNVIQNAMLPSYKTGDLSGGTLEGVDRLIAHLDSDANPHAISERCLAISRKAA